jgi:hypothetical protein
MSTQTSQGRFALSALMQRLLRALPRVGQCMRPAPSASRRSIISFEALEPRFLLSADLIGDLSAALIPDHVLPSDQISVPVIVRNAGADAAALTPVVRL